MRLEEKFNYCLRRNTILSVEVWAPTDWETYSMAGFTKHLVEHKAVDEKDFLFKATCMREKACLTAYVAVKPDYPSTAPIFCLSLAGLASKDPNAPARPPGSPR